MKKNCIAISFFAALLFYSNHVFCQKNKSKPLDSALEANSEKWKVKLHKGMFGMANPEFGPFSTDFEKLDSPVLRKRTKDGSYSDASISSDSWDWDFSKYETVEKRKAYRMLVARQTDTAELLFSIYRVSQEKNLTFPGELMSKNDEGKNLMLGYKTNISGILSTAYDTIPWRFFIEDSFSRKEESTSFEITRITRWYMITNNDSLYTEPMIFQLGKPGSKYYDEWQMGVFVNNSARNHIAALKFGAQGDLSNPFYAWIRKDIEPIQQHAIASLLSLLVIAKTY